jgi:D-alanine-D-alanine ligase
MHLNPRRGAVTDDHQVQSQPMHLLILHQHVPPDCAPDELDVLEQVKHVQNALTELAHTSETFGVTGDFTPLRAKLATRSADLVFNLVESIDRQDSRMVEVPELLEELGMRYTGCDASAIRQTNDKLAAKLQLRAGELPTPDWATPSAGTLEPPYIIKARSEHASRGMDANSLVTTATLSVPNELRRRVEQDGIERFAEAYIEGREFNVSLLGAGEREPEVLPLAEIDFTAFGPGKPRFVDYNAKWNADSFEYQNTPRVFVREEQEPQLCRELRRLAQRCWEVFGLAGYARVDFRIDPQGRPWILEVNCNPCLSPDAGFAAALARAGISFPQAIARILADALLTADR